MRVRRPYRMFLLGLSLAAAPCAHAASGALALCLDASTRLDAGADVSDKELKTAEAACARLRKSELNHEETVRINAAAATLDDEERRRAATHH